MAKKKSTTQVDYIAGAKKQVEEKRNQFKEYKKTNEQEISYLKKSINITTNLVQKSLLTTQKLSNKIYQMGKSTTQPLAPAIQQINEDYHIKKANLAGSALMRINPFLGSVTAKVAEKYGEELKQKLKSTMSSSSSYIKNKLSKHKNNINEEFNVDNLNKKTTTAPKSKLSKPSKKSPHILPNIDNSPSTEIPVKLDKTISQGRLLNKTEQLVRIQSVDPKAFSKTNAPISIPVNINGYTNKFKQESPKIIKSQNQKFNINKLPEPTISSYKKPTLIKNKTRQLATAKFNLIQSNLVNVMIQDISLTALEKLVLSNNISDISTKSKKHPGNINPFHVADKAKTMISSVPEILKLKLFGEMLVQLRRIRVTLTGAESYLDRFRGVISDQLEEFMDTHRKLMHGLVLPFRMLTKSIWSIGAFIFKGRPSKYTKDLGKIGKSPLHSLVHIGVHQYIRLAQISDRIKDTHKLLETVIPINIESSAYEHKQRSRFMSVISKFAKSHFIEPLRKKAENAQSESDRNMFTKTANILNSPLSKVIPEILHGTKLREQKLEQEKKYIKIKSKPFKFALEEYFGNKLYNIKEIINKPKKSISRKNKKTRKIIDIDDYTVFSENNSSKKSTSKIMSFSTFKKQLQSTKNDPKDAGKITSILKGNAARIDLGLLNIMSGGILSIARSIMYQSQQQKKQNKLTSKWRKGLSKLWSILLLTGQGIFDFFKGGISSGSGIISKIAGGVLSYLGLKHLVKKSPKKIAEHVGEKLAEKGGVKGAAHIGEKLAEKGVLKIAGKFASNSLKFIVRGLGELITPLLVAKGALWDYKKLEKTSGQKMSWKDRLGYGASKGLDWVSFGLLDYASKYEKTAKDMGKQQKIFRHNRSLILRKYQDNFSKQAWRKYFYVLLKGKSPIYRMLANMTHSHMLISERGEDGKIHYYLPNEYKEKNKTLKSSINSTIETSKKHINNIKQWAISKFNKIRSHKGIISDTLDYYLGKPEELTLDQTYKKYLPKYYDNQQKIKRDKMSKDIDQWINKNFSGQIERSLSKSEMSKYANKMMTKNFPGDPTKQPSIFSKLFNVGASYLSNAKNYWKDPNNTVELGDNISSTVSNLKNKLQNKITDLNLDNKTSKDLMKSLVSVMNELHEDISGVAKDSANQASTIVTTISNAFHSNSHVSNNTPQKPNVVDNTFDYMARGI